MSDKTIVALFENRRWDEAKRLLQRLKRRATYHSIIVNLFHESLTASYMSSCPVGIIGMLVSESFRDKRPPPNADFAFAANFNDVFCSSLYLHASNDNFYYLCRNGASNILQVLLEEYFDWGGPLPSRSLISDMICDIWRSYLCEVDCSGQNYPWKPIAAQTEKQQELLSISNFEDMHRHSGLHDLWKKTEILLKTPVHNPLSGQGDGDEFLPIHRMIRESTYPSLLIWLAMKAYPDHIRKRDHMGCLPLHCAVNGYSDGDDMAVTFDGELSSFSYRSGGRVGLILGFFPEAARYLDRNFRLPVSILIDNEFGFEEECVLSLLKASPKVRDIKSHMPPFMLAAAEKGASLDLVFKLLREDPAAVSCGIKDNDYEHYLKTRASNFEAKLSIAKKEVKVLRDENDGLREELALLRKENERLRLKCCPKRIQKEGRDCEDAKRSRRLS